MDKKELQIEQKKLDETIKNLENRNYYIWEQTNTKGNNSRYGDKNQDLLDKMTKEPYFGRFDIYTSQDGNEIFYIGKQGIKDNHENLVVVDWRMPMATVYYNFTPGELKQEYEVEVTNGRKSKFTVDVLQKREFTIKNQRIKKILQQVSEHNSKLNTTLTEHGEEVNVNDAFLRELMENSETTGYLKEIIATIQKEQDLAIRQPIARNVIIQGVAGSGKSSIALHRLSFLMFNNRQLSAQNFLILGPSKLFISSFQGLLPELNLQGINQKTFLQLAEEILNPLIKDNIDIPMNWYFEKYLFKNPNSGEVERIRFKGSEKLAVIIDIYLTEMEKNYEDRISAITIADERISREDLLKIYHGYDYLPFAKRVERFQEHVTNHYKSLMDRKINDIEEQKDFIINDYLYNGGYAEPELQETKSVIYKVYRNKTGRIKTTFTNKMKSWKKETKIPDLVTTYKGLLSREILSSFENEIGLDVVRLFEDYELKGLTYFDIPPLLYINQSLYEVPVKYAHIIVDEAQDLSFMHFSVLKNITKTMTILGDIDQSIYLDYGQDNWDSIFKSMLDSKNDSILNLKTSYRSTKQIIDIANTVLKNQFGIQHETITPMNRNGSKVQLEEIEHGGDLLEKINTTIKEWKKKYKRIAIIHKDEQKAKKLAKYLQDTYIRDVIYINPEKEVAQQSISVLTSYNSKGMEFDAVILANINEESFPKDNLHARLLYVLVTRAQHELKIFYDGLPSTLLEGVTPVKKKVNSRFDDIL